MDPDWKWLTAPAFLPKNCSYLHQLNSHYKKATINDVFLSKHTAEVGVNKKSFGLCLVKCLSNLCKKCFVMHQRKRFCNQKINQFSDEKSSIYLSRYLHTTGVKHCACRYALSDPSIHCLAKWHIHTR